MTLEPQAIANPEATASRLVHLSGGMIGFPEATLFELVYDEASLPLMWLRSTGSEPLSFPVVEPGPLVDDYRVELSDNDASLLAIESDTDRPLVLSVVTVHSPLPQRVTVNLIAPVVINRRTQVGKQVLIENYQNYSIEHTLIDERVERGALAC